MASIPDVQSKPPPSPPSSSNDQSEKPQEQDQESQTTIAAAQDSTPSSMSQSNENGTENIEIVHDVEQDNKTISGVKACDDTRYRKYFKMLQFGVPAPAVKLKMANEGFDSNVLE